MKKRLGEALLSSKLITREQLAEALEHQKATPAPLGQILVQLGHIAEDVLLNAMAATIGVRPWHLDDKPPVKHAVELVPGPLCRSYQMLPVELNADLLTLAMLNPNDLEAIELVRNMTGLRVEPVLPDRDKLMRAIERIFGAHASQDVLDNFVRQASNNAKTRDPKNQKSFLSEEETRPVVGLVNQLLSDAIRTGASDIHIEPRADRAEVRFRVDGQLQKVRDIPADILPMLTTRLKIMAELDIVEYRVPQDGRMSVVIDSRTVDLRVSVLPNHHGQRIVLRILDQAISLKTLDEIGFADRHLNIFRNLIRKPYGMLLVTGPTGSGKTTTLYAALGELREVTNNIMTCEDPIEYEIEGVNQSQVHEKVGLTFAAQLRAILRQDPDVILVGEIRDGETAETALRASMTGHLVLSTLHCNDSPSAIPRLFDMDVDPFLLSTSLIGVMSQRLLRVLCPHCRYDRPPTETEKAILAAQFRTDEEDEMPHICLYEAKGCPSCQGKGYRGRTAVHEIMPVTGEVARLVAERATVDLVAEAAHKYGYRPMHDAAMKLVMQGKTSLAEAMRHVMFESPVDWSGRDVKKAA